MTLTLEQRRERDVLKRKLAEIMAPVNAERKAKVREAKREQRRALQESAAEGKRRPRKRDNAYLAHTRLQPCMLAGVEGETCSGRIDPAHLRYQNLKVGRANPGMGNKSDDCWVLPLCRKHHDEQHAHGNEARWWAGNGIDPDAEAQARYAAFNSRSKA